MINKSNLSLWVFFACFILYKEGAKIDDENRPYEFGFTIDGQQHRHERKDANGIIQGEFGFITADGVYHVTAYATDENGRFKILSMRNVKISGPLDGLQAGSYTTKPLPIGQSGSSSISPPIISSQNAGFTTSTSVPRPVKIENVQNVQVANIGEVTKRPGGIPNNGLGVVSTTNKPIAFTTQPTVKPACAGCGYVTKPSSTTARIGSTLSYNEINIQKKPTLNFDNQNIGNQKPNFQNGISTIQGGLSGQNIQQNQNRPSQSTSATRPNQGTSYQSIHGGSIQNRPNQDTSSQSTPNQGNSIQSRPGQGATIENIPNQGSIQSISNQGNSIQILPNQEFLIQSPPTQGTSIQSILNRLNLTSI